jgi:hypothetical protein
MFIAHKFSPLAALSALMMTAALFIGSTGPAFAAQPGYQLTIEAPASVSDIVVVRDVLWKCSGDACSAKSASSRPEIVCASAARKIGRISAFTANGTTFAPDQLEKCNAKAKKA